MGLGIFLDVDTIWKVLWEEFSKQISVACDKIYDKENVRCQMWRRLVRLVTRSSRLPSVLSEVRNCPFNDGSIKGN